MQTQLSKTESGRAVFRRTSLGQRTAVGATSADLSEKERHLLLMVTGFTPIKHLAQLAPQVAELGAAASLLEKGLLEEANDDRPTHH